MPNGSKLWRYRYRFNGMASMLSFGDYPSVSLKDARLARDAARKLLSFQREVKQAYNPITQASWQDNWHV